MATLIQVIYASSAKPDMSEHDVSALLRDARSTNRKHNVSGMMLFIGGAFLQLLEGEAAMVDVVCNTIFRDKRHMRRIVRETIAERQFPEWTMGFEVVDLVEAAQLLDQPALLDSQDDLSVLTAPAASTLLSIIGRRRWQADRSGIFHAVRRARATSA